MADEFFRRFGIARTGEGDFDFVAAMLKWMADAHAPYEQVLFDWFCGAASAERAAGSPAAGLYQQDAFTPVRDRLMDFAPVKPERLDHDYFKREQPCTMLIDEVEAIWAPIADDDDWTPLEGKLKEIAEMREAYGFEASRFA
jgi:hypothetical protein